MLRHSEPVRWLWLPAVPRTRPVLSRLASPQVPFAPPAVPAQPTWPPRASSAAVRSRLAVRLLFARSGQERPASAPRFVASTCYPVTPAMTASSTADAASNCGRALLDADVQPPRAELAAACALGVVFRTPVENGGRENVVVDLESLSPSSSSATGRRILFAGQDRQHGSQRAFVDVRGTAQGLMARARSSSARELDEVIEDQRGYVLPPPLTRGARAYSTGAREQRAPRRPVSAASSRRMGMESHPRARPSRGAA